jgi:hypothetical protein
MRFNTFPNTLQSELEQRKSLYLAVHFHSPSRVRDDRGDQMSLLHAAVPLLVQQRRS